MTTVLEKKDLLCENVSVNEAGHLCFAGQDVTELAEKYGTPLYLMDEDRIRERCRTYREALSEAFGKGARAAYASKAASFKEIYRIMADEGMLVDVVSCGEIFTAHEAGFPLENALFHSNNKTDEDVAFAMAHGIGYFVADNQEELYAVDRECSKTGRRQKVLLRLTPGIDPHTFAAVSTGKVDSKFGSAIETGQAKEITATALSLPGIELAGYHCHIGSQIFDDEVYLRAADVMLTFMAQMRDELGFTARILDLGGGFGVRYLPSDPHVDIRKNIFDIADFVKDACVRLALPLPAVILEPGRSIVADAGMTLYTAGTVKKIPEFVNYVSVDGGMTDNVRFAMYKSPYTLFAANKMNEECTMTASVVGRCCESGDVIQEKVALPASVGRGDVIACLSTGAYNYSMASNYNRIPRPPVVMLKNGTSRIAVRRETYGDLASLDN
ncbi:MAG: diaminopimelate decarboxylase [Clostridia bacterium]|nr:diaminopimelate decarboxylase [Clostridia bacterium]